jgi:hypothetical protein
LTTGEQALLNRLPGSFVDVSSCVGLPDDEDGRTVAALNCLPYRANALKAPAALPGDIRIFQDSTPSALQADLVDNLQGINLSGDDCNAPPAQTTWHLGAGADIGKVYCFTIGSSQVGEFDWTYTSDSVWIISTGSTVAGLFAWWLQLPGGVPLSAS